MFVIQGKLLTLIPISYIYEIDKSSSCFVISESHVITNAYRFLQIKTKNVLGNL